MKYLPAIMMVVSTGLLVSCGSSDNNSSASPTKVAVTSSAPSSSASANTVNVGLQEWSITPNASTAKAGSVTFNVRNTGPKQKHEFVILKTDLAPADLPKKDDGTVDEEGEGITSPGEISDMAVGEQKSLTVDLTPGKYLLICNLVDEGDTGTEKHFDEGMYAQFTVQ